MLAAGSDDCLAVARRAKPDILVIDLGRPSPSRLDVLRELRGHPPLGEAAVIAVAAEARREHRQAALDAGANRFLTKPVNPLELASIVEAISERRVAGARLGAARERLVKNQTLFRRANEMVKRASENVPGLDIPSDLLLSFICECADRFCTEEIRLTRDEYEALRSDERHFSVRAGHERSDIERVVERHERYNVVEKHRPSDTA